MSDRPRHWLVVTYQGDEDWSWRIECERLTPACAAWEECRADGCDTDELERLEDDGMDVELHGVEHQQIDGYWMTATETCFARVGEFSDDVHDMVLDLRLPGGVRHAVEMVSLDVDWHELKLVALP